MEDAPLIRVRGLFLFMLAALSLFACSGPQQAPVQVMPELTPAAVFLPAASPTPAEPPTASPAMPATETAVITPSPTPTPDLLLCSPLVEHDRTELTEIISDPYAPPPPNKPEERHHGVDFSYYRRGERLSIEGVGVQSALAGRVAMALTDSFPYGNVVIIETPGSVLPPDLRERIGAAEGESLYLLYAHLGEAPPVVTGDEVTACQPLGTVGKSGNAGIAHLHLETRLGPPGQTFAEMGFYLAQDTPEERENYLAWRISGVFRHFNPLDLLVTP